MAGHITGYQFDKMRVAPENDALLYHHLNAYSHGINYEYKDGLAITDSGLTATVGTGSAIIFGHLVEVLEPTNVTIPPNSKGYICLTVDLSKTNESTGVPGQDDYIPVNNQVRIEALTSLTQQDLLNGGSLYTFPIRSFTSDSKSFTHDSMNERWVVPKILPGFKVMSGNAGPRLFTDGRVAILSAQLTNTNEIQSGANAELMDVSECTYLDGRTKVRFDLRSKRKIHALQQGSGNHIYLGSVNTLGIVEIGRYRLGGTNAKIPAGSWFAITLVYPLNR